MQMQRKRSNGGGPTITRGRVVAWSAATALLLLPLAAMQVTDEVNWGAEDFIVAAAVIGGTGLLFELALRHTSDLLYRAGTGVGLAGTFLLIWLALGVGIIGRDGDPANLLFGLVLIVGLIGAAVARGRAHGMARVLLAMALVQTGIAVIALVAHLGAPWSGPVDLLLLNGLFVALFSTSALLFRAAARRQTI